MLGPGSPADPIQIIDVRDLVAWMMKLVEARTLGTFNAVSAPRQFTMGDIISACERASPKAGTKVTWVPEGFLTAHWKPGELDFPPWAPLHGEYAGISLTSSARAVESGLRIRSMEETVRDTLAWFRTLPAERQAKLRSGIDPEKEALVLRTWRASRTG